jgi:hypothetical protein
MAKIILKTTKRSTTVKRSEVRHAVSGAFRAHAAAEKKAAPKSAAKKAA